MINFYARLLFLDPVDDAITPHSMGTVTVEFAG